MNIIANLFNTLIISILMTTGINLYPFTDDVVVVSESNTAVAEFVYSEDYESAQFEHWMFEELVTPNEDVTLEEWMFDDDYFDDNVVIESWMLDDDYFDDNVVIESWMLDPEYFNKTA